jgi:ribulose-phosphate 3-epimerase
MILRKNLSTIIQIDGGINLETGRKVIDAGADSLVAGNFVFRAKDPIATIKDLKRL